MSGANDRAVVGWGMADDRERDFEALGGEPVRVKPERTVDEIIGDMARAICDVTAATSGVECPGCGQPIGGKGDEVTANGDGIEHRRDWHGNDIMTKVVRTGTVQHADGRLCVVADVDALFAKLMADGKPKRVVDTEQRPLSSSHMSVARDGSMTAHPDSRLFDRPRASPSTERTHLVAELLDMRDDRTNESGGDLWPETACVAFVDRCIAVGRDIERGWGERDDRWAYTAEEIAEAEAKGIPLKLNESAAAAKRADDDRLEAEIKAQLDAGVSPQYLMIVHMPDGSREVAVDPLAPHLQEDGSSELDAGRPDFAGGETITIDGEEHQVPAGFAKLLLEGIERRPMLALGVKPETGTPYSEAMAWRDKTLKSVPPTPGYYWARIPATGLREWMIVHIVEASRGLEAWGVMDGSEGLYGTLDAADPSKLRNTRADRKREESTRIEWGPRLPDPPEGRR